MEMKKEKEKEEKKEKKEKKKKKEKKIKKGKEGKKRIVNENEICDTIFEYGKDVLNSEIFCQAASETHHLHGTVLDHTINVCVVSLWLCRQMERRGITVNKKDLVQAALCHDLGMVGRNSKYKDRVDSWKEHPKESARIARELIPDLSPRAEEIIISHMWPLAGSHPTSNEGMVLCIADKYASMTDWRSWLTKHKFAARIKERLEMDGAGFSFDSGREKSRA